MANLAFYTMGAAVLFLFLQFHTLMDFGLPIMSFTKAEWQPIRKLLDDDDFYCQSKYCPSSRMDRKDTCDRKRCDCVDNKVKVECKKKKIPVKSNYVTESEIDNKGDYEIESETNSDDSKSEFENNSVVDYEIETVDKTADEINYETGYEAENESHIDSMTENESETENETGGKTVMDIIGETGYEADGVE